MPLNLFETINENITACDAAEYYGLKLNRSGMCNCIFHNDRNPSMKVDKRYFCFGCGATGDAADLTAQLFGLSQRDAALKLAADFGIDIKGQRSQPRRRVQPTQRQKTMEQILQKWTDHASEILGAYRKQLVEWHQTLAPGDISEELHPLYEEALMELPRVEYLLGELCIADYDGQVLLKNSFGNEINRIEGRLAQLSPGKEELPLAETKKSNQERLKEITESIETGIRDLFSSDRYQDYLRTMSRFHNYSVNNTILIYMQKPDATLVAGFSKWKNQFQRHVNQGEKGIRIIAPTSYNKTVTRDRTDPNTGEILMGKNGEPLKENVKVTVPMFKPVTVFDISQTSGKPLPQLAATLTGDVQNYEIFMEALRRSSPVPIEIRPIESNADGFFSPKDQLITIRDDMSQIQTVCAAVHEIAHSKLHNYAKAKEAGLEVTAKDHHTEEVEAESVAFSVCAYYGIETGENSLGYIAGWSKDKTLPELKVSLDTITKTASELITDIDQNTAEIRRELGLDRQEEQALFVPSPDPGISLNDMYGFGYLHEEMLPLSRDRAMELYEENAPVYLLFEDNTEAVVMGEKDITLHAGIFGITPEDWANVHEAEFHAEVMAEREKKFLDSASGQYAVYQLRDDAAQKDLRFMDSAWIAEQGMQVQHGNYDLVYVGTLPQGESREAQLEAIYEELNMHRPSDFTGHSLSVSDVVAINSASSLTCHYCDTIGFRDLPDFMQQENYLKNAEITLEDDYGMIDGILNNGQREDLKTAESNPMEKKSSVLQKLKTIKAKETLSVDGQTRSVEYESMDL